MQTKKIIPFLVAFLVITLSISPFIHLAKAQGDINYGLMPNYWQTGPVPNKANVYLDHNVLAPSGRATIRIGTSPGGAEDEMIGPNNPNDGGVINGHPYGGGFITGVHGGDHVIFGCWIKTDSFPGLDGDSRFGGEIGFDAWTPEGDAGMRPTGSEPYPDYIVPWGTSNWKWVQWDFIVPYSVIGYPPDTSYHEVIGFSAWLQTTPFTTSNSNVWFADAVVYINPTGNIIEPTPSPSPVPTPTQPAPSGIYNPPATPTPTPSATLPANAIYTTVIKVTDNSRLASGAIITVGSKTQTVDNQGFTVFSLKAGTYPVTIMYIGRIVHESLTVTSSATEDKNMAIDLSKSNIPIGQESYTDISIVAILIAIVYIITKTKKRRRRKHK